MANTFFGFDTSGQQRREANISSPSGGDDDCLEAEEEYDALNDETFGALEDDGDLDDWEQQHEELSGFDEQSKQSESIENSISKLVFDDGDVSSSLSRKDSVWAYTSPTKAEAPRNSLVQYILDKSIDSTKSQLPIPHIDPHHHHQQHHKSSSVSKHHFPPGLSLALSQHILNSGSGIGGGDGATIKPIPMVAAAGGTPKKICTVEELERGLLHHNNNNHQHHVQQSAAGKTPVGTRAPVTAGGAPVQQPPGQHGGGPLPPIGGGHHPMMPPVPHPMFQHIQPNRFGDMMNMHQHHQQLRHMQTGGQGPHNRPPMPPHPHYMRMPPMGGPPPGHPMYRGPPPPGLNYPGHGPYPLNHGVPPHFNFPPGHPGMPPYPPGAQQQHRPGNLPMPPPHLLQQQQQQPGGHNRSNVTTPQQLMHQQQRQRRDSGSGKHQIMMSQQQQQHPQQQQNHNMRMENNNNHHHHMEGGHHHYPGPGRDEYAGLMSNREKQWLLNIQMLQLNTGTPYFDDYYYTVYKERKQKRNESQNRMDRGRSGFGFNNRQHRDGGRNERQENTTTLTPRVYMPQQFENSLGKLQCGSVTAPRKIIDTDLLSKEDEPPPPSLNGSVITNTSIGSETGSMPPVPSTPIPIQPPPARDLRRTKQLLLELEALYSLLLRAEDLRNPVALANAQTLRELREKQRLRELEAAPTPEQKQEVLRLLRAESLQPLDVCGGGGAGGAGAGGGAGGVGAGSALPGSIAAVGQGMESQSACLGRICGCLFQEDKVASFLNIRKGKMLLLRILPHLMSEPFVGQMADVWQKVLLSMPSIGRRDTAGDNLLPQLQPFFKRYVQTCSMKDILEIVSNLVEFVRLENSRSTPLSHQSKAPLHFVTTNKFGVSALATMLIRSEYLISSDNASSAQRQQWFRFVADWMAVVTALAHAVGSTAIAHPLDMIPRAIYIKHMQRLTANVITNTAETNGAISSSTCAALSTTGPVRISDENRLTFERHFVDTS